MRDYIILFVQKKEDLLDKILRTMELCFFVLNQWSVPVTPDLESCEKSREHSVLIISLYIRGIVVCIVS